MQTLLNQPQKSQTPTEKLESILDRLAGVQVVRDGYRAICPSHDDHTPSLAIREGYKGVLVRCWAGCTHEEICQAIGLEPSELFYDAPASRTYKTKGTSFEKANLHYRWPWRRHTGELTAITSARRILAEDFLQQVKEINPSTLTDSQREKLHEKIALAEAWVQLEESAADLCYSIAGIMRKQEVHNG